MQIISKTNFVAALIGIVSLTVASQAQAQPDPRYKIHDFNRPQPPLVDPGYVGDNQRTGKAPSDAIVLFDGSNLEISSFI